MTERFVDEIVDTIARKLGRNVVLDDPENRLLAYTTVSPSTDRARTHQVLMKFPLDDVRQRQAVAAQHSQPFQLPADREASFFARLGIPLFHGRYRVGTLWVQADDYDDDLEQPAGIVPELSTHFRQLAAYLHGDRLALALGRAIDAGFIDALIHDANAAHTSVSERIGEPYAVLVMVPAGPDEAWPVAHVRQRILTQVLLSVTANLRLPFLGGADADHGVLAIAARARGAQLARLQEAIRAQVRTELSVDRVALGVSADFSSGDRPSRAFRQALAAAQAQAVDPLVAADWDRIGIYRYLAMMPDPPQLPDGRLGALLAVPGADTLIRTLEAVYDSSRPKAELAAALHLHRATLYNRLARIERIIGADPLHQDVRLELHFALKARRWARRPLRALESR
ncbi:PucR family transcriptional regulator [Sediminivirga luteola]|uniref:PucR family transcriptional regulator n=1 Tax=Sediminivirga luteola TaxID=1774748 RepID=UPI001F562BE8|nr:helix-turn-helix domain-containing protein [Sediminivirga luteola]